MQLFSADAVVFSKKSRKNCPQKLLCSWSAQTLLFHSPAQTTAHSSESIFHTMKSRDQTSALLSVWKNFQMGASEMQEIFKIGQTFKIINEIAMGQDFEISFIS